MSNGHKGIEARRIPAGAVKITDKLSDAVAYIFADGRGRPCAKVYYGKQAGPVGYHDYRSEAEREKSVARYFAGRQAHDRSQAEYKAARLAPNALVVGDILNTCWGYDQTNREFYEVVEVCGQHVVIREIAQARQDTAWEQWKCAPQSGEFVGKPMRKLVQHGRKVAINGHITASKWNTATVAGVPVGPALSASGYA